MRAKYQLVSRNLQIPAVDTTISRAIVPKRRWNFFESHRTEKTLEIACECEIDEINDTCKPEILSEIYRHFSISDKINNEYNCDMAETMTKMTEFILEDYSDTDVHLIAIVNDKRKILIGIESIRPLATINVILATFEFNNNLIRLMELYEMKTEINTSRIKSAKNI